ncbi:hypothetical protein J2849_003392 [Azospirillum melinis]|nr:hypothetical protein [Azospirillum melinis]
MHTSSTYGGTILLLGAGRMGSALLRGWLAQAIPAAEGGEPLICLMP